jgi:hypothetical protein
MGFGFNRDGLVRKGGRPKKGDPAEEDGAADKKRPDLLTMEDQVCAYGKVHVPYCAHVLVRARWLES